MLLKLLFLRKLLIISFFIFTSLAFIKAEGGGDYTYAFLNLTNSAHTAALGGKVAAYDDSELSFVYNNPSLLNGSMDHNLSVNYSSYFEGINFGYAAYAKQHDSINTFSAGMYYVNYGTFIEADNNGLITGSFRASDYVLNVTWSHVINKNLIAGVSLKPIYSSYYKQYQSAGLASDLGICYKSDEGFFVASAVIKNLGFQLFSYSRNGQEPLPFEIIGGVSQKLRYAPFRFILTFQELNQPDLTYRLPDKNTENSKALDNKGYSQIELVAENIIRHTIAAVEFTPTKSFFITSSINFRRRKEMQITEKPSMVGFSFGAGVKLNKYRISYSRSSFHVAGGYNSFSINTNLKEFYQRVK